MGRATRWLRSLFGLKKDKLNSGGEDDRMRPDGGGGGGLLGRSGRETGGLCLNPNTIPPNITPAEAAWLKSFYCDSEKEQNKHAIAVAAATAAAADAAVAAAQAAAAVVRLTSQNRGGGGTEFGSREKRAVIRIQTVFRGYLARKAHRALKGLVKLQALVRGYLVRKQATATLHSMQALIRAQATVRAHRNRGFIHHNRTGETSHLLFPARKSVERFEEANNKSVNSSRLSASFDSTNTSAMEESSTKIVEVDTGIGRPKSRSRRTNTTDSGDESSCQSQTLPSPRFYRNPARLSIPTDWRNSSQESDWWGLATGEECRGCCTAQSTPRFASGGGTTATAATTTTPANNNNNTTGGGSEKSISMESLLRSMGASPNYMANTQSFKAKLRSQSAPKQRPEPAGGGGGSKRRILQSSMESSRNSVSGVRMQRSCSQVQEVLNFKNTVIGRIGRSVELVRHQ